MAEKFLSEYCSHCEQEFTVEWDISTDGWIIYCPHCGHRTFMCNMCKECNSEITCPGEQQQAENFNKLKINIMETKKILMISTEKARELYENGSEDMKSLLLSSFSKEELEQPKLPKTWEKYCNNEYRIGYYINSRSEIRFINEKKYNLNRDRNLLKTKEDAEAHLALMQLHVLRDAYRDYYQKGWKSEHNYLKGNYAIHYYENHRLEVSSCYYQHAFLTFPTKELAEQFLKNFKELIEKAKDLI